MVIRGGGISSMAAMEGVAGIPRLSMGQEYSTHIHLSAHLHSSLCACVCVYRGLIYFDKDKADDKALQHYFLGLNHASTATKRYNESHMG